MLLFATAATAAVAQPVKFTCDTLSGKRIELGASGKGNEALWIDDNLDEIRPAVPIDGQTFSVTGGSSTPPGARRKATTYVFAAAHRDAASILATGIDDTTAEISRFYFGNKILCKLTSGPRFGAPDGKSASPFVATYVATSREQQARLALGRI